MLVIAVFSQHPGHDCAHLVAEVSKLPVDVGVFGPGSPHGCPFILADNAYNLTPHLQTAFKEMKRLGLAIRGAYFNADMGFDTREARKTCFNHGLIPNIPENLRNRKQTKRGRKRLFNAEVYQDRFCAERTFAWVDKFKRLLIRFERYDACFLGAHYLAFTMINLRHVLAKSLNESQEAAPTSGER